MTNSNQTKPVSDTAGLTKSSPAASVELTEGELSAVSGGDKTTTTTTTTTTTSVGKAKTADKAFAAMDGYIRG